MILVTGGTGLIGSHLIYSLLKQGKEVCALKRHNSLLDDIRKVFHNYSDEGDKLLKKISWIDGDIRNMNEISGFPGEIDEIYHTAAVLSFNKKQRQEMTEVNVGGTSAIVEFSLQKDIKKFCFVSSVSALGLPDENGVVTENSFWERTRSSTWYSWSKLNSELEVWKGMAEGLDACIVNPSVILGHGSWSRGSGMLFSKLAGGQRFYTGGMTGFVDVRDVVDIMIRLMDGGLFGERYILNSENLYYRDVINMIALGLGAKAPSIKAGRYMTSLAWRLEKIASVLNRKAPRISREIARSSQKKMAFSNEKIAKTLGIKFIPVANSIREICAIYKNEEAGY